MCKMTNEAKEWLDKRQNNKMNKCRSAVVWGGGWHNKWAWKFHSQFQLLSVFLCLQTRSCCLCDSQKDESSWILTQRSVLKLWRTRQSFLWICWRNICRDVIFIKETVNICWGIVIEEDSNLFLIFIRFVFTFHCFIFRKCFVFF